MTRLLFRRSVVLGCTVASFLGCLLPPLSDLGGGSSAVGVADASASDALDAPTADVQLSCADDLAGRLPNLLAFANPGFELGGGTCAPWDSKSVAVRVLDAGRSGQGACLACGPYESLSLSIAIPTDSGGTLCFQAHIRGEGDGIGEVAALSLTKNGPAGPAAVLAPTYQRISTTESLADGATLEPRVNFPSDPKPDANACRYVDDLALYQLP